MVKNTPRHPWRGLFDPRRLGGPGNPLRPRLRLGLAVFFRSPQPSASRDVGHGRARTWPTGSGNLKGQIRPESFAASSTSFSIWLRSGSENSTIGNLFPFLPTLLGKPTKWPPLCFTIDRPLMVAL